MNWHGDGIHRVHGQPKVRQFTSALFDQKMHERAEATTDYSALAQSQALASRREGDAIVVDLLPLTAGGLLIVNAEPS